MSRVSFVSALAAVGVSAALCAYPAAAGLAAADQGPAKPASASSADTLETVVVTGSYLRRTDTETTAPVQVITAEEIEKSGKLTVSDVIRSVSADNSGTLTQNFSGALAGGASGIALRGLTLDATLVLVDGHRMAPYPLADDGQRPFVDLSSLPLAIVERVEVLKDGASAIYGSDAIAGVVNVILKPQFKGLEVDGNFGGSYRGDGLSQWASALYGFGDLAADGHNVYLNLEYRHSASISQADRGSYLSDLDLRPYGGPDRRGGIVQQAFPNNGTYTVPGMVAPQIAVQNGDPNAGYFLLPGCAPQNLNYSGGCTWDINQYNKIQPRTAGLNFTGRWTQTLGQNWRNGLTASFFNSQSEQYRQSDTYSTGPTTLPDHWVGSGGTLTDQTNPFTTKIVLPSSSPDNPFNPASPYAAAARTFYGANYAAYVGQPALLYVVLTDFGPQVIHFNTDVVRLVNDVTGEIGGWSAAVSLGYIHAATRATYDNFIRASLFDAALANGTYRVGANAHLNPPSLYAALAPETHDTATSELAYLSANASHDLAPLPGGALAVAVGAEARTLHQDNPGEPYAPQGDIMMDGSFYARGSQSVSAAFAELSAPVFKQLELDGAARVDHYNTFGSSFTPKVGLKWTLVPQLALRGTFARGFRAPGIAESGYSGTGSSTTAPVDPLRCPFTNNPNDCGQGYAATLSVANPNLKPERSRSYTGGFVLEPVPRTTLTADYFYIQRNDEIVPAPLGLIPPVRGVQQPGTNYPGPIIYYPQPYVNASFSKTNGIDFASRSELLFGSLGTLTANLTGTYLFHSQQTFTARAGGDQTFEYAGTVGPTAVGGAVGTPRVRGSFGLDWTRRTLSIGAELNFRNRMQGIDESTSGTTCIQLNPNNPNCWIGSFTYLDMYGQYQLNDHAQLSATVTNVTNRLAPLNDVTYGGTNYNPSIDQAGAVGRFYELAVRYRF
ncbi:MAG: TonB-dependent receptor [Gammaproteobacteria bacterium]|nr:TonB-dependent receptor [Gammaproteobacteria bacterium]